MAPIARAPIIARMAKPPPGRRQLASRRRIIIATFRRPLLQVVAGIIVGTAITLILAASIKYTELPGSESDLSLQGIAVIIGYGIVMLGVCMLACVVPTRRALNIEPTVALRTE